MSGSVVILYLHSTSKADARTSQTRPPVPRSPGHACAPPSSAPSRRIGDPQAEEPPRTRLAAPPLKFPRGPEGQKPPRAPPGPRRSGTRGPLLSGGIGDVGATGTRVREPTRARVSSAAGPWGQTFAESRMRNARRSPPPRVCCELATFSVL
uniref:formin-like protein 5 n=1 Tax=Arvicanthis niloticus TaxID=61156 RepID=UPI001486FF64|nr:formin-like protein 5 [Arvicanthis niloticus]